MTDFIPNSVNFSARANLDKPQTQQMLDQQGNIALGNGIMAGTSLLAGFGKDMLNYSMMNNMIDMQTKQMDKYYGLQGDYLSAQTHIADNNLTIQSKQLDTAVKIAELQKDRDVVVAKYRTDASVKINRDTVLAQTYVQQNPIPQNYNYTPQYYGQAQYPLH